jgi:hypothetical protein
MNNLETQYTEATNSLPIGSCTAFVESGMVSTKDGSVASQLDITSGVAWLMQTDSTLRRRAPTSTNRSTSGHPSTTMYLFLQNDGTYAWQTSSSGPSNSLAIAHCTTDGSSNILVVTDDRDLNPNLFNSALGNPFWGADALAQMKSQGGGSAGANIWVGTTDPGSNALEGDIWIKA